LGIVELEGRYRTIFLA